MLVTGDFVVTSYMVVIMIVMASEIDLVKWLQMCATERDNRDVECVCNCTQGMD